MENVEQHRLAIQPSLDLATPHVCVCLAGGKIIEFVRARLHVRLGVCILQATLNM